MNKQIRVVSFVFVLGLVLGLGFWQQQGQAAGKSTNGLQRLFSAVTRSGWFEPATMQVTNTPVVLATGGVGTYTSQAIVNGNPAISYYDEINFDLKYIRANDANGASWGTPVTVQSSGNVGKYTSLAVVNGRPAICYYDESNNDLKYIRASDANGASWGTPELINGNVIGQYSSLAVVNGRPAVSYYDPINQSLKFARADDANGTSWVALDSVADGSPGILNVGHYSSLKVVNGRPAISYYDITNGDLKYVRANNADGTSWGTPVEVDDVTLGEFVNVGFYTSLEIVNGNPAISYYDVTNNDLKYVRANDANGTAWGTPLRLDGAASVVGFFTSLAVVSGNPAISYYDLGNGDLKYLRASDANGTSWFSSLTLDSTGDVGYNTSLLALANGKATISYCDVSSGTLKWVSTDACTTPATPTITASGATTFCAGGSVTLTSSSMNGNQWYLNGNPINGATNQSYVVTATGSYSVTVSASDCGSAISAVTSVTVNPLPATPTITTNGPTTFSSGGSVTLTSSSPTNNQWLLNGAPIGGATNQSYTATTTGIYTVRVTGGNGCTSTSAITEVTVIAPGQLDSSTMGKFTSQTIVNGNPAICYLDTANSRVRYVRANDAAGTSWGTPVTVAFLPVVTGGIGGAPLGKDFSLKVVNGNPALSYYEVANKDLKYVRATDANGTSWGAPVTVESNGDVGQYTSLAVINGNPAIGYYHATFSWLQYVRANDANGSSWGTPFTVAAGTGNFGQFASLAAVNGNPAISFYRADTGDLVYMRATDASGTSWGGLVTLDSTGDVGRYTSLAVVNGNPAISYYDATNGNLKYVNASDASGTAWEASVTLDSTGNVGQYTSLTVVSGNPAIGYYDVTNGDLKYIRASNAGGSNWFAAVTVDGTGNVGQYASMIALTNGKAAISHYDATNDALKWVAVNECTLPATPTITASGATIFCGSGSVTLSSSSQTGNQWFLNGNPLSGATNQTYTATAAGSYTVVATASVCANATSAATTVTVNPIPATPTVSAGGPTTFTQGGSVTLTSSSATGNQWFLNGSLISGATNQTYSAASTGSYTVTTTANGCSSAASSDIAVLVLPLNMLVTTGVGKFTSQTLVGGNPAICYLDSLFNQVKYIRANDAAGTSWGTPVTVAFLPGPGVVGGGGAPRGRDFSLKMVNGNPALSYYEVANGDLKYVRATDANGTSWGAPVTVDSTNDVGQYSSLAVVNGKPAISYYDVTGNFLRYVQANDASGTSWGSLFTPALVSGQYTSLTVVNGNPAISYYNSATGDLEYIRATNVDGTNWGGIVGVPVTVESTGNVGQYTSLAVVNGNPAISYYDATNGNLKYVRASDASGTNWDPSQTLDSPGNVGQYTSLTVVNGNPAISYYDVTNGDLKYIRASNASGTAWSLRAPLDSFGDVGQYTSMVQLANGRAAISYYDTANNGTLKWVTVDDCTTPPTPTITAGGSTFIPEGSSVTLTSSSATGNQWYLNGNPLTGATNQSYVATTTGNYTVIVTVNGCVSATSAAVTVTVFTSNLIVLPLDSGGNVGQYTSQAIVNGNPAISYYDVTNGDLKYVRANNAAGTAWGTPVTIDSTGNVGQYTSLAVVNGAPAIGYYDATNGDLKFVRATNVNGTAWSAPVTVDSTGDVGWYASLKVINGNPAISYYDASNNSLKYARAVDASGATWGMPLTLGTSTGQHSSLAVVAGNPALSYHDGTFLMYLRASNADGTSWGTPVTITTIRTPCTPGGPCASFSEFLSTALAVVNGSPAISFFHLQNKDLMYVRASDSTGAAWNTPQTLDSTGTVGEYNSLALVGGNPLISYYDNSGGNLKYIRASNADGTSWNPPTVVDSPGNVGQYTSLAAVNGSPAMSYYDVTNGDLKWAWVDECAIPATPTVTADGPTTFCSGGSVLLTSSSATGNQWYLNGSSISGATNSTYNATAAGNYTVIVTAGSCSSAASAATVVTVNPIPATPTITTGGPTTFCAGGSVTLTSSSATGNQWYLNGSSISGATNQTYNATAAGNYTVIVTDTGCSSAASAATSVTVNSLPATPTITTGGPTTFCESGSVTLTSSSATGNQWYRNGSPISGATNQTYSATLTGNYTVIVTTSGCASASSAATSVTVTPMPATPTITAGGTTTFCEGGSVTLTSSSVTGNQWYLNGSLLTGATGQTYTATQAGSYTVVVTANGCASQASAALNVTVNPTPATPTISTNGPTTFCSGGSVLLTSSSAAGNQWYLNGSPISGATNATYNATAAGNYTVIVTAGSCSSAASAATVVTINPIPTTPTITTGGPTTFCAGGSVTLTSSSATGNQWYRNGGPISGATNQTYAATAAGNYTVIVTTNGCSSAASSPVSVSLTSAQVVTTNADSGAGSLRQAIADACPGSTITFAPGISLITLTGGELVIDKNLTIQGPGTALTISGNNVSRVFKIGSGVMVALHGLTVANGLERDGGGIYNQGDLALTYCTLTGNRTNRIFNSGSGGGIYNLGNLMLTHCTLTGNTASNEENGRGGGILNAGGMLTLINCTLSGNSASNKYGGCSTCTASGGGISNSSGSLTLINSTLSGNSVSGVTCAGCTIQGGGISNSSTFTSRNSLIAGNSALGGPGPDVAGALNSLGYNLLGNSSGTTISGTTTGNLLDVNPQLAPLDNYGGPTQTFALLSGSPAINAGDNCVLTNTCASNNLGFNLTTDQRGPGFNRQVGSTVDIGAVEWTSFSTLTIAVQPQSQATCGSSATFSVIATGSSGLSYQWRKNGVPISGATGSSYTFTNATAGDNGAIFSVVVTDEFGTSVTSNNATLALNAPTVIVTQPADAAICDFEGSTATFTVVATGTNLTYRWIGPDGRALWDSISPTLVASVAGFYTVQVTGACGTVNSRTFRLTRVQGGPATVTQQPQNTTVCEGAGASFFASFGGSAPIPPYRYQWYKDNVPIGPEIISNFSNTTLTIPAAMTGDQGSYYVSMRWLCSGATSNAATLTVNPRPPTPTITPGGPTSICQTGGVLLTSSNATGNQWYLNGNPINGATGQTYNATTSGSYTVVTVANGCNSVPSSAVNVTANTAPTLVYGNVSVNAGGATMNSPTTATDNGTITGYAVQSQGTYTGAISVNASGVVSISNAAPTGAHTITIRATDNCGATTDATFTLTVGNNAPTITAGVALTRQRGSAGTLSTIATVGDTETAAGSLVVTATTAPAGLTVTSITNAAGTITANVAADCTATIGANTVVLTVTDGNSGTATANLSVNVTANSAPTLTYSNASVNAGTGTTVNPATGPTDNGSVSTIVVQSVSPSTAPGTITVNASGVVTVPNNVPAGTYTVTIRATDNCGATTDAPFTLTVSNTPPSFTPAAALSRQQGSTAGAAVTIGMVSDAQTAVDSLTVTQIAGGTATGITVSSITNTSGTITAVVTASCTATPGTVRFQVSDGTLSGTGDLTVNVTANTAPSVTYAAAAVNAGGSTSNSPTSATDNGSITGYAVQSQGTYTGTISVNALGVVSLSAAAPVGTHTITIRATDNCGTTADASFTLTIGNNAPTITAGAALTRQRGSAGTVSTIATVGDTETAVGSLVVTATTVPAGITVTSITNTAGTITANVAADCTAASGANTVVLTVTDGNSGTATANLTVNVTANSAPTLTYAAAAVNAGSATTNSPTTATDNGTISSYAIQSQGAFTGTISVNAAGVVSISNAAPVGTHTITIRATDNCGATTDAAYTLSVSCSTITVTNPATTTGTAGVAFSQTFTQTGGSGATTFSTVSTLPTGLTLATNGVLSGTPTQTGTFALSVKATDSYNCSGTANYSLTIACPTITLGALPNGTAGTAYSGTLSASPAGTYQFSSADKPAWLNLASNGALSGTPPTAGIFNFNVTVTGFGSCSQTLAVTLTVACPTLTVNPATLSNANLGAAYRETLTATPGSGHSFSVTSGVLPNGLTLNANGTLSGTPTTAGTFSFSVTVTAFGNCTGTQAYSLTVTSTCAAITVNPTSLPGGTLGTAYSQTITATSGSGAYTFSVASGALPPGLTLDANTGVISGTPTAGGTFTPTLKAAANGCSGTRTYVISIVCGTLTINPAKLPNVTAGVAYNQQLTANVAGTYSLQLGSLPPGISLTSAGLLNGMTTQTGTYSITVKLTAGSCTGTRAYTLTVNSGAALRTTALAMQGDYDGDDKADLTLWSAGSGVWNIARSSDGQVLQQSFGAQGDVTLLGDYDGDGKSDLAVFRPGNATFYIKRSSDGQFSVKQWGLSTDVPVPGDYDGDGITDIAVWRGSNGTWDVLRSSDGQYEVTAWGASVAPYRDVAVPGDYDGDGKTDLAVFRRATGTWLIKRSSDGKYVSQQWGLGTDVPVAADYDGDGLTDIAVWRGGTWYIWQSATDSPRVTEWGTNYAPYFDRAAPGDYDGDGLADVAVWRASEARWYIASSSGATLQLPQGRAGDAPVAANPQL